MTSHQLHCLHFERADVFIVDSGDQGGIKCGNQGKGSSIAKDLIHSKDPKHTLFCRETAFVAIYALFQG